MKLLMVKKEMFSFLKFVVTLLDIFCYRKFNSLLKNDLEACNSNVVSNVEQI